MKPPYYRNVTFWGVGKRDVFNAAVDGLIEASALKSGWFAGDNLIAFGRNLGFLNDKIFIDSWRSHTRTDSERSILWRTATVLWAARQAFRHDGDFIECGCYRGTTSRILLDCIDLSRRKVFLYDLFEHDPSMAHDRMPAHSKTLFGEVQERFSAFPNVRVIKGSVPSSFEQGLPDKIAFAHIDMNNVDAEIGALNAIESRLTPGAVIVLDDFGALPYRKQHLAETEWFAKRGVPVLELPTSQGLAIW